MRPVGRLCGLIWLLTAGLAVPAATASEQRVALVIGNSAYAGAAALKNPVNDARAMGTKLRALGFDVTEVENGTKQQMERAIGQFSVKLNADSVSMFFYAGHGMQVNGKNYLMPVDAEIATEQTVRLEAVDVDAVLDQMSAAQARVNIVVLDACRNNPFERRFRGQSGGLASMDAPAGSYIAYATAPGKVAADGAGNNGLYTSELLAALDTPNAKIEDVFKHVRASVMEKSAGQQTPWESSSLTGDFYFHAPTAAGAPPATVVAAAAPSQPSTETLFWETIKDSRDPADFRAYLQQYPNGSFAALARNRVAVSTASVARGASPGTPMPAPTTGAPQVAAAAAAAPSPAGLTSPSKTLSGAFVAPKPGTKLFMSTGGGVRVAKAD
ncbi:MAG TPA: caspase family protein, partial [Candidatus Sulfotelmatobacter sp.]|nr:caspase family protein [Candidatus Sulfotelmatobacter sp.]